MYNLLSTVNPRKHDDSRCSGNAFPVQKAVNRFLDHT